jgi:ubiquinone/menaquinone biosynthesis C-methylase UbiE
MPDGAGDESHELQNAQLALAEVGCGTGVFMSPLVWAAGPRGKVHMLDSGVAFVPFLQSRRAQYGLTEEQVHIARNGDVTLPLEPASIDVLFLIDTYHHIEYPALFLPEVRRVLKVPDNCKHR